MKTINVVAAIIYNDNKIFTIARSCGKFKGCGNFQAVRLKMVKTPRPH